MNVLVCVQLWYTIQQWTVLIILQTFITAQKLSTGWNTWMEEMHASVEQLVLRQRQYRPEACEPSWQRHSRRRCTGNSLWTQDERLQQTHQPHGTHDCQTYATHTCTQKNQYICIPITFPNTLAALDSIRKLQRSASRHSLNSVSNFTTRVKTRAANKDCTHN